MDHPELVVPGLLGVIVFVDVLDRDISVGSVGTGVLAIFTLVAAVMSMYTLYTGSGGGVFFGGTVSLMLGVALAVTTVAVDVIRLGLRQGIFEAEHYLPVITRGGVESRSNVRPHRSEVTYVNATHCDRVWKVLILGPRYG
ncbi:MAG: hypothetical protein V5A34_02315 [Halapricum sp.]